MTMIGMLADHRQAQTISPRLQHAVRLLQMSSLDFSVTVRDLLEKNPFLEIEEGDDEFQGGAPNEAVGEGALDGAARDDHEEAAPRADGDA
ncbi:MAG: hypothetical protein ACK4XK_12560, partial [Casimicrobiaceae bacterium]